MRQTNILLILQRWHWQKLSSRWKGPKNLLLQFKMKFKIKAECFSYKIFINNISYVYYNFCLNSIIIIFMKWLALKVLASCLSDRCIKCRYESLCVYLFLVYNLINWNLQSHKFYNKHMVWNIWIDGKYWPETRK